MNYLKHLVITLIVHNYLIDILIKCFFFFTYLTHSSNIRPGFNIILHKRVKQFSKSIYIIHNEKKSHLQIPK